MFSIESSYLVSGTEHRWLRGNHHAHSTRSDGLLEPSAVVTAYEAEGYHYLALSEHDRLLAVGELQATTRLCLIPAVEVTARTGQTLMFLGADRALTANKLTPRQIMEQAHALGGLFVFDHPNWQPYPSYASDEVLDSMTGLRGIEIYTGVIERMAGQALATDRWDRLLSKGWHVFGHATDDNHAPVDQFIAWNQVQWPQGEPVTAEGIVAALTRGQFYATTGVTIREISVDESNSEVLLDSDAVEIHWLTEHGRVFKKERASSSRMTANDFASLPEVARLTKGANVETYVRAECLGCGNQRAWTQPFWVRGG